MKLSKVLSNPKPSFGFPQNFVKVVAAALLMVTLVAVGEWSDETITRAVDPTCAEGGVCEVGDIGPGGGIVFYVTATPFTSDASCGSNCLYLEMAPKNWYGGSSDPGLTLGSRGEDNLSTRSNTAIGLGFKNTSLMKATSPTKIAVFGRQLPNLNAKTDWFLPNLSEYLQIKAFLSSSICTAGTRCADYTTVQGTDYWTSHYEGSYGWAYKFPGTGFVDNGGNRVDNGKLVRPIRAFKSVAFSVTYDSQLGSAITAGSTTTGGSISTSPGTPTRTGYEFVGWFAGASGGAAISFPYAHGQTSSFTLYAQWTANALTVTTDEQGGTAIDNTSTTTGG